MKIVLTQQEINGKNPEELASLFLKKIKNNFSIEYPINPFKILTALEIPFTFRPFQHKCEGIYIPAGMDSADFAVVGINLNRPVTRQRYTAAHELCHHIKDTKRDFFCLSGSRDETEKFAENFAAVLLMPSDAFLEKIREYEINGYVNAEGILRIADFFGVSFKACINRAAYDFHRIEGNPDRKSLESLIRYYKPDKRREELGFSNAHLYRQIFDAGESNFSITYGEYAKRRFQNQYVYYDSRMEGLEVGLAEVSEVIADLRLNKQNSPYCSGENQNITQIAGLSAVYDLLFHLKDEELSLYLTRMIHRTLFSFVPFPEAGGQFKTVNNLVLGAKFETVDSHDLIAEFDDLDQEITEFLSNNTDLTAGDYIEWAVRVHHRLTVIHPYPDGNGRTSRAFLNLMLIKRNLPPVFFDNREKNNYKAALAYADQYQDYTKLYEVFYRVMLKSNSDLTDF
ncbi:MAG: ImmA/IrrE family metallo-endopeptidase [Flexilinea sp.]